ncbi:MAG: GtrA family protein [Clostridiales bacterium]|nr:GtrA family protein [Clostridiales bacterium]
MNEETKSRKEFWRALKFTLFSISAGIIQIVSFELFSRTFGWPYWVSYLTSLVLSVLWNFTFNRRYTFRSDGNVPRAMLLVALFYLVFTPLSTWWGDALTGIGWNKDLVMIGTMLINFVTEFLYQKLVVYRNTTDTNDLARKEQEKERAEEAAQSEE